MNLPRPDVKCIAMRRFTSPTHTFPSTTVNLKTCQCPHFDVFLSCEFETLSLPSCAWEFPLFREAFLMMSVSTHKRRSWLTKTQKRSKNK